MWKEDEGMEGKAKGRRCLEMRGRQGRLLAAPPGPTTVNHFPGRTDEDSETEEVGLGTGQRLPSPSPPLLPPQDGPEERSSPHPAPQASACARAPLCQSCRPTRKPHTITTNRAIFKIKAYCKFGLTEAILLSRWCLCVAAWMPSLYRFKSLVFPLMLPKHTNI